MNKAPVLLVQINLKRGQKESWIGDIREAKGVKTIKEVASELGISRGVIGLEKDVLPANYFEALSNMMSDCRFMNITPSILKQRSIKSKTEIELIKKAAIISNKGLQSVKRSLKPGMTEVELELKLETAKKQNGHEHTMVERTWPRRGSSANVVISGPNVSEVSGYWITMTGVGLSASMPYGPSNREIQEGDLVDVNHATVYRGYHSDEARMFKVGKPRKKEMKLYNVVLKTLNGTIASIRPGVRASDLFKKAKKIMDDSGHAEFFMGYHQYGVEYVGHGVGLEIDEVPFIGPKNDDLLEPGMVFTLEPKIIIPGVIGVEVEDTVMVTEEGYEVLTSTPNENVIEC
mgnify:CR=1 FL=1